MGAARGEGLAWGIEAPEVCEEVEARSKEKTLEEEREAKGEEKGAKELKEQETDRKGVWGGY